MNRSAQQKQPDSAAHRPSKAFGKPQSEKSRVILAGALEVFTTQGYAAASMDRIAKAAGVSKPTLYSHFKNKEGLFIALIQQLTEKQNQMLLNLPTELGASIPPEKVLHRIATSVLEGFSENHKLMTLMRLIIGESERFPALALTFVREVEKPLLEKLCAYLGAQTQLNFLDPMVAARIFVGSLAHYMIVQKIMQGETVLPLDRELMVKGLVDQLMAGGNVGE